MPDHYTTAKKFKEQWWHCNNADLKIMEEGKIVCEAAYILLYKQM